MGCSVSRESDQLEGYVEPNREIRGDSVNTPNNEDLVTEGTSRSRRRLGDRYNLPIRRVPWTTQKLVSNENLLKARLEFWETRVTGREEIWSALRMAVEVAEHDIATAQQIINASGITVPTGDLSKGVYDEHGNCYIIPQYCISNPTNIVIGGGVSQADSHVNNTSSVPVESNNLGGMSCQVYTLKVRFSDRGGHDLKLKCYTTETVGSILQRLMASREVQPTS